MTPYDNTLRWLTRRVIIDGVEHKLAIVELIFADENGISTSKNSSERHIQQPITPAQYRSQLIKTAAKSLCLNFFDYICIANVFSFEMFV